jgi:hypothetical protein
MVNAEADVCSCAGPRQGAVCGIRTSFPLRKAAVIFLLASLVAVSGCLGPRRFPLEPMNAAVAGADGVRERRYDTNGDRRADVIEVLDASGRLRAIRYDRNFDGKFEREAPWPPPAESKPRHLLILLDSIPYDLAKQVFEEGRFAAFHRPTRVLAPFPVMTDPSMADFFGVGPVPGVEASYFDGNMLVAGAPNYMVGGNAPWMDCADFHLPLCDHGVSYLLPNAYFRQALAGVQAAFQRSTSDSFVGYVVATSGVGSKYGAEGHLRALRELAAFCQQMIAESDGALHITLMSDHGHTCIRSPRISLGIPLRGMGYRVGLGAAGERDVVIPEWGLVSLAALYCRPELAPELAADVVKIGHVELAAYRKSPTEVVALSPDGRAVVEVRGDRYRYVQEAGDPLRLARAVSQLRAAGKLDADGFGDADAWFSATVDSEYPDPLRRLHRAFNDLFRNVPQVYVSLADGVCHGSPDLSLFLDMAAVHGSLRPESSYGFAMSTIAELPPALPMAELRAAMNAAGIPAACANHGQHGAVARGR